MVNAKARAFQKYYRETKISLVSGCTLAGLLKMRQGMLLVNETNWDGIMI